MMKTLLLRAFALFFFAGLPVAAEIIGVETFDYADGALAARAGGVFWDYKNTAPAGRSGTASAWSNLNGTPNVTSGQLVTSGNGVVRRAYNGSNESEGAISDANVAKTVYYRVNVTTGLSVAPGDYFGISSVNAGTEVFYFGKRGVNPNWAVEEVGVGGDNSTLSILPGRTYTLVAQVDLPGDAIRLYVDPNLSAAQSANTPTASRAYTGTAASTGVRFAAGTAVRWDNLVVATTWEELQVTVVTTAVDENGPDLTGSTSLREAVNHSPPGSTILFAPALNGQTCTLSTGSEIVVTKNLTLDASSLSSGLTIDGGTGTNRLFSVNSGQSLTLRGLTLTGGNSRGPAFDNAGGAILNSGTLTLTQCTLYGNSAVNLGGAIWSEGTLTLTQCTLSGNSGTAGGAIYRKTGTLTLTQCTLSGNSAGEGGAIWSGGGTLTLTNSIVAVNSAPRGPDVSAGTITTNGVNLIGDLSGSTLTASDTLLTGDPKLSPLGYFGGPVQTMHPLIGSPAIDAAGTINPGGTDARGFPRFEDGDTASPGKHLDIGAVEAGIVLLVNQATDSGGSGTLRTRLANAAILGEPSFRIVFDPAVFPATPITLNGNQLTPPAGIALFIDASNLSGPVTISGNNASRVFNIVSGATVAMHSVRIVNGKAADGVNGGQIEGASGGGILNAGSLSLFSCTLSGNAAGNGGNGGGGFGNGGNGGFGGGIFSSGSLSLTACTLSDNAAGDGGVGSGSGVGGVGGNGGGIFSSGSLSLTSCTLSGNAAGNGGNGGIGSFGGNGGGIRQQGAIFCRLTACTIVGNQTGSGGTGGTGNGASGTGGGISGGNAILESCLIGLNTRGPSTPNDVNVTSIAYVGGNLLSTAANVSGTGPAPTINPNPLLAPLGDYGGPTQTMPPLPGSPAIDAAAATTAQTDQRGFPRSRDGDGNGSALPDIGAVEASLIAVTNTNDTGTGSLRQAVLDAAAQPGPDTVYFTAAVTGTITLASEITISDAAPVTIDATGLSGGLTIDGGTGTNRLFYVDSGQSLTLRGLALTGGNGGGAAGSGFGGAIRNAGTLTLTQCTLSGNSASFSGGAIDNNSGSLTLTQCTLSGNSASSQSGGAIRNVGTLTLTQCTLSGNSASNGGAIYSNTDLSTLTTTLTHCTLTGNIASSRGGALYNNDGRTILTHCTLAGNTAPAGQGSGVASFGDIFTETVVKNTLISGNGGSSVDFVISTSNNSFTSQGGNLIGSGNATGDFNQPGDVINDIPKLSPLGYFGGRVQTMHPLIGSPAIDAIVTSDPGGTDARGFPRFEDGDTASPGKQLDIGAVEAGRLFTFSEAGDGLGLTFRNAMILSPVFGQGARLSVPPNRSSITLTQGELVPPTDFALFIDASNLPGGLTLNGNQQSRVFNIPATSTVALHSLRLINGKAPDGAAGSPGENGGGIFNAGRLSLFSCTLAANRAGTGSTGGTGAQGPTGSPGINTNPGGNGGNGENGGVGSPGGNGGGIFSRGPLTLTACTLSANFAGTGGTGGTGGRGGTGGSSLSGRGGDGGTGGTGGTGGGGGFGGGVYNEGPLTLTACTLANNVAGNGGTGGNDGNGGEGGGAPQAGNPGSTGSRGNLGDRGDGGGIYNTGPLHLGACTVSGNAPGSGGGPGNGGGIVSTAPFQLRFCIVANNGTSNIAGTPIGTSNFTSGNPLLAPLGDNGGPTQTMRLLLGSPARNAGTATARLTDQRGFPIVGAPDLGAYEAQIGAIADVTLVEGATLPTRTFPVGQIGALTATSSNTTLVPEGNIVITGSGASRSVTVTPAAGHFGVCTITLTENLRGEQQMFQFEMQTNNAFLVTNANDSGAGSLRNALSLAASTAGINTISFALSVNGSITLTSEIIVNDTEPVVVDASSLSGGLVLNAGPNSRHFDVAVGASLTLRNMTLQDGNVTGHGGSVISFGTLILERCRLMNNRCTSRGGAVESQGPVFRAVDCSFTHNSASLSGGALGYRDGIVELTRCTFAGNTATTGAAVISDLVSQPAATVGTFLQCTFANNTASNPGSTGGIEVSFGTLNLIHCTVSQNTGIGATGGLKVSGTDVTLTHCIIAGNTSTGGGAADILLSSGTLRPRGANLIGSNQGVETIFPAGPLVGTAAAPRDPMLESFNSYGGLTFTMPPRVGSPALDQATVLDPALTTDQRGFARPLGIRPDLGAVEASIIVVTTPVDELDPPGSPGNGVSLREAVRDLPENGVIDFDRAIFGGATAYVLTLTQGPLNPERNGLLFNSANPNGILIGYVATFTQQPQSQSVAQGATATFSVNVANLSGGVGFQWRKGGEFVSLSQSLSISNAQESDEGVYDVVLRQAPAVGTLFLAPVSAIHFPVNLTPFAGVSQPASLVVDGAPVTIRQITTRTVAPLGSSQRLSVVAVGPGTLPLTYQWSLNGKRISGATQSTYSIPKLALTHAGSYSCVVKSGLTEASASTELAVVDTTPKVLNIKSNTPFTATVIAAGNGLAYFWRKDGAPFFNLTGKTFTLSLTDVSDTGLFTCDVSFQGGGSNTLTTGFNTRLNVSDAAPVLATPLVLPPAYIGQSYFYRLPVVDTLGAGAASFSVTGALPKGVVFNRTTGVLSGRPTVTKSAGYPLSFRAINPSGSSAAVAATLTVNVVPPTAVGVFAGPLGRSALNGNLGGRFDLTTTAAGSFSGSITLGTVRRSFRNQLLLSGGDGDVILRGDILGIRLADNTLVTAYVEVFAAEQVARVTLVAASGTTLEGTAWRNPWRVSRTPAQNNPATAYAARYHLVLDGGFGSSVSPEGSGFASFPVSNGGTLTLAGRLPDGSGVTGGTFVGPDGQVLVFNLLYGNRGSQVGQFQITKAAAVVDNTLTGTTSWLKPEPLPRSTDTVYKAGFGPLNVNAVGGVYVAPAKGAIVSGFTAVAADQTNAMLTFSVGGLTAPFSQLLRIANPSATGLSNTAVLAAPIANTLKITSFNASTGTFAGSFILPGASPALNRPAPFFGQLVEAGGVTWGYGYFLLPQVPVGTEKVSTAPKLSGSVLLQGL